MKLIATEALLMLNWVGYAKYTGVPQPRRWFRLAKWNLYRKLVLIEIE